MYGQFLVQRGMVVNNNRDQTSWPLRTPTCFVTSSADVAMWPFHTACKASYGFTRFPRRDLTRLSIAQRLKRFDVQGLLAYSAEMIRVLLELNAVEPQPQLGHDGINALFFLHDERTTVGLEEHGGQEGKN